MTLDRLFMPLASSLAVLALTATGWILIVELAEPETMTGPGLVAMPADLGGPLALTDHRGLAVSEATFKGDPTLIAFGYSFCPDICPMTLQTMAETMDDEARAGRRLNGAFITVDPERDTTSALREYMAHFHERIVGLTGTAEAIDQVARSFRVRYRLRRDVDAEAYPVDHSKSIYLMDRYWQLAAVFRHDATVDDIRSALQQLL